MVKTVAVLPPDIWAGLPWYAGDRELALWRAALEDEETYDAGALGSTARELADDLNEREVDVARVPALSGHGRTRAVLVAALESAGIAVEPLASALVPSGATLELDGQDVLTLPLRPDADFLRRLQERPSGSVRALGVDLAADLAQRSPFPAAFAPDDAEWIEGLERGLQRHCPVDWPAWRAARLEHRARANGLLRAFAGELLFDINPGLVELIS